MFNLNKVSRIVLFFVFYYLLGILILGFFSIPLLIPFETCPSCPIGSICVAACTKINYITFSLDLLSSNPILFINIFFWPLAVIKHGLSF